MFREVPTSANFPELEHRILDQWKETDAFRKRVELNRGKKRWSFIDGPITANNPMGVHHAWGRTYKDLFQRYYAMKGFDQRYQNGFDCQGLWIEVEVEKELGFQSKKEIEAYGIDNFVRRCKQRVMRYAAMQTEQSIRLGYWMGWDDPDLLRRLADGLEKPDESFTIDGPKGPVSGTAERLVGWLGQPELGGSYYTMSDENNYTIWAVLKKCHSRGWIYKGRDVMPWCPRCSTALSEHEIVTEGYRELTHPGLTIKFPLRDRSKEALLVWTTTPWTLTSNVAAAVHPELVYAKIRYKGEILYLIKAALARTLKAEGYELLEELKGAEMEGWEYQGPYDELPAELDSGAVKAHCVVLWDDVSEEEGTGIVHIAPGCGKEDLELGKQLDLPVVAPLDEFGAFLEGFDWLTGTYVYQSAEPIIEDLGKKGLLFRVEDYTHRYPVCWRCQSELVFRLVDEWFISMGEKLDKALEELTPEEMEKNLRYQIMDVTRQIRWIPGFGLQQELDWLRNMEDWMISKKRYWGLALPIWECKKCGVFEVIGSEEELKTLAVEGLEDFEGHSPHKPWIDGVKIKCPRCGAKISRIPDVGNPWLDAGIVAYSTLNYRHDREYWRKWFPADLITESFPGQFRNWFYSMLAMSTIMERQPSFLTCFTYASLLGEDGREMHKSWGNAIWFDEAAENMGADVMRWMFCSHRLDDNMLFGYTRGAMTRRQFLIPLWNVYGFFATYANLDKWSPEAATTELSPLDRWILSKLQVLIREVTARLDDYDPRGATELLQKFVEDLSTWYVRRSRRRFWKSEADADKRAGYTTLHRCLTTLARLLAPFIPFLSEEIYQNVVRSVDPDARESVHLTDWPEHDHRLIDEQLMSQMDLAMRISGMGRSARNKSGIKLRQPLARAVFVADKSDLENVQDLAYLVEEELNVKELLLTEREEDLVQHEVVLLPQILGKKHGALFPKLRSAVEALDRKELLTAIRKGEPVSVSVDGDTVVLLPEETEVRVHPKDGYSVVEEQGIIVGVETRIDAALEREGLARDIVRRIQNLRKQAGFNIADRITLYYQAGLKLAEVFGVHGNYIAAETLSTALKREVPPQRSHLGEFELAGEELRVGLVRVEPVSDD
ncbi:MAG: isoleucine--tRNA ligase [Nitrososphaeria archaeon]